MNEHHTPVMTVMHQISPNVFAFAEWDGSNWIPSFLWVDDYGQHQYSFKNNGSKDCDEAVEFAKTACQSALDEMSKRSIQ